MVHMEFKVRFFVVALLLSVIVGVAGYIPTWLLLYRWFEPEMYSYLMLVLSPVLLVLEVVVPFAVFFSMSRNGGSTSAYWTAIVSVFFGCWIGSASVEVSNMAMFWLRGAEYTPSWLATVWIAWLAVSAAVSRIFFVSLSAVLFAYYRGTVNQHVGEALVKPL